MLDSFRTDLSSVSKVIGMGLPSNIVFAGSRSFSLTPMHVLRSVYNKCVPLSRRRAHSVFEFSGATLWNYRVTPGAKEYPNLKDTI